MEDSMYQLPVTLNVEDDIWTLSVEDAALLWALLEDDIDE